MFLLRRSDEGSPRFGGRQRADRCVVEQSLGVRPRLRKNAGKVRQAGTNDEEWLVLLPGLVARLADCDEFVGLQILHLIDEQRDTTIEFYGGLAEVEGEVGEVGLQRAGVRSTGFGLDLESRITLRAIGPHGILQALSPTVPIFSIAGFFAANNDLAPVYEIRGALLAASVAMTVALSILAERLAARRPIWGWARSLPRAASARVRADALGFALVALPIALATAGVAAVATGPTDRGLLAEAAGAALALVPPLSACAAAAIRGNPEARIGPSGEIFWMGFLSALLTTLVPPLSLGFLAATPWLLNLAARRERAARPSRFGALRHLSDGDPFSLGGSR